MAQRKPESAVASKSNTRHQRDHIARNREASVTVMVPPVPGYMGETAAAEWSKMARRLSQAGMLTVGRLDYLEQYALLRADLLANPEGASIALHNQLKQITRELWTPMPGDDPSKAPDNTFTSF